MACACGQGECRECRLRAFGQDRRKYHWTPELLELLREAYRTPGKHALSARLSALERRTGWPRHAAKTEAIRLGIVTRGQRRGWTPEEDEYLAERAGVVSVTAIARHLGRSLLSVESRMERLHLSRRVAEGYNVADLATVFGTHHSTVRSWMRRGLLGKVHEAGGLRVTETNVVQFVRQHASEYDLRRVDQDWFKGMVFGRLAEGV